MAANIILLAVSVVFFIYVVRATRRDARMDEERAEAQKRMREAVNRVVARNQCCGKCHK